jgi:hypothetical protein
LSVTSEHQESADPGLTRRGAVRLMGLASLALALPGCAGSGDRTSGLPDPVWPDSGPRRAGAAPPASVARTPTRPRARPWSLPASPVYAAPPGVIARSSWAHGAPVPRLMDRMRPITRITIHHDGMTPFTNRGEGDAAQRLENIRLAHRGNNWGDIGYHYLVDPAGRVWEGRPLSWQGAHVKDQNQGNIGVCVMGNFERQQPNDAQLRALETIVAQLMSQHNVSVRRVYTHRELAATACPGRNLQPRLVAMRGSRGALAMG